MVSTHTYDIQCSLSSSTAFLPCADGQYTYMWYPDIQCSLTSLRSEPHPLSLYLVLMVSAVHIQCSLTSSTAFVPCTDGQYMWHPMQSFLIHCLCTLYWWSIHSQCSLSSSTAFVPCTDGQYTANAISPHPLSLYLVLMVNTHPMQCCFIHCLCTLCWSVHIHVTYTHPMQSRLPSVGYTSIIKISPNISIFHISQKLKIQDYLFPNFKESKISKLDKYVPFPYFLKFKHGKLFHFQCNLTYAHSPHSQDGSD